MCGADADIVIFDPAYKGVFSVDDMLHDVDYCAYEGMEQIGRVDTVLLRGKKWLKIQNILGKTEMVNYSRVDRLVCFINKNRQRD